MTVCLSVYKCKLCVLIVFLCEVNRKSIDGSPPFICKMSRNKRVPWFNSFRCSNFSDALIFDTLGFSTVFRKRFCSFCRVSVASNNTALFYCTKIVQCAIVCLDFLLSTSILHFQMESISVHAYRIEIT